MIVTKSDAVLELVRLANRVARSSAPVLLTGESGTGKELFAQLLHDASPRHGHPLVRVNCAALSSNLIESELFGHEKGAFTDAANQRIGRFELAGSGTLFLDEISEVPLATQAKLLRVLESNEFERVGSSVVLRHNVRIVAASNRHLEDEIRHERFRLDLFHRLNVICLEIPPLRERPEDIDPLAHHFLSLFQDENPEPATRLSSSAMDALRAHSWPGNVRELRNVIHRACVMCQDSEIRVEDLRLPEVAQEQVSESMPPRLLKIPLEETEREIILAAMARERNQQVVAKTLGISPRTLTNKLRRYREAS
ncbi:MAG: sigma-54 dependent transcriptional regulator [Planctomycetota bacterium]